MVDNPCKNSERCTGCGTCIEVCSHSAIRLAEDEIGQYKPIIDKDRCVGCHVCEIYCPENNNISCKGSIECYAAVCENECLYDTTSSGGVATAISEKIIDEGGVVYGATFLETIVKHIRVETKSELEYIKGSRYVQSIASECFPTIKKDLESGRKVLFIGTPCQIAGVKSYLRKVDCSNLLLIDLVCHGVPPMAYLREYIHSLVGTIPVQDVIFRVKNWKKGVNGNFEAVYDQINIHDLYCYAFAKGIIFRENCYYCRYAQPKRSGDITVGDFWGLGKTQLPPKSKSLVLVNTESGKKYWDLCKSGFFWEQRNIEEALNGNSQLRKPCDVPSERKAFLKRYKKMGFTKALRYSSIGIKTMLFRIKHKLTGRETKGGYGLIILRK